ncbi:MAG: trypsin-like peptidase domain-containing protein [Planctomycetes bacterium]|nr:trypsin-like peptidase domain-containing protein [Planctomycetota bacterium]
METSAASVTHRLTRWALAALLAGPLAGQDSAPASRPATALPVVEAEPGSLDHLDQGVGGVRPPGGRFGGRARFADRPDLSPGGFRDDEAFEQHLIRMAKQLRARGGLVQTKDIRFGRRQSKYAIETAPRHVDVLDPAQLHEQLQRSVVVVAQFFQCGECEDWHLQPATGFAVGRSGAVATSWHVLETDESQKSSYLVVATLSGRVFPVRDLLCVQPDADLCVLGTEATDLWPLPLRTEARVGESVYCLSNPEGQFAYFSEGRIARKHVFRETRGALIFQRETATQMLQVTLDFAYGSSGAPIVDACGNLVGIATATQVFGVGADSHDGAPQLVFRGAVSATHLARMLAPPGATAASRPSAR